jgi:phytoene dehydrogenase-like protein
VLTGARAERVLMADRGGGRRAAAGVRLAGGAELRARRAIVSNAGGADALRLLAPADAPPAFAAAVAATPLNESFMHLHLGFDAAGLEGLGMHHIVIDSWDVTAPQNVVLISIASVADPALAPAGKHVLHAYTPATEPWALWEGLDRDGEEYEALKEERAAVLWRAVERVVPGIRARVEVAAVGTPLTQARFVNRHRGSYGPAHCAGEAVFPFGNSAGVEGFYCVGDFAFPGIGLPAVAASGMVVASSLVPVGDHLRFLDRLGL